MEPSIPVPPEVPSAPTSPFQPVRSFARLGLGAVEIAAERLRTNLRLWELRVQQVPELLEEPAMEPEEERLVVERDVVETDDMLLEEVDVRLERAPRARARSAEEFRLALIGAVFDSGERLGSMRPELPPLARGALNVLTTALNVIGVPEALQFARGRLSPIRGMTQERFDELVRIGRREERHARLLAEVALEDVSDSSVGELAARVSTSDEVRQVIRTESGGATGENGPFPDAAETLPTEPPITSEGSEPPDDDR